MVSNKLCLEGTFSPPDLLSANSYIIETRSCDKEQICKAICSWIEFSVSHAFAKRVKLLEEKGGKEKGKTVFIQHTAKGVAVPLHRDDTVYISLLYIFLCIVVSFSLEKKLGRLKYNTVDVGKPNFPVTETYAVKVICNYYGIHTGDLGKKDSLISLLKVLAKESVDLDEINDYAVGGVTFRNDGSKTIFKKKGKKKKLTFENEELIITWKVKGNRAELIDLLSRVLLRVWYRVGDDCLEEKW
eukprot:GHVR01044870.1.p1 GENE.GHVR01044870.1~~GHVR01044870.1.p1  ORF type:complete len:243 (-),score=11.03 GHVR01044870.1:155-883(-)